ncbi:unnamed protein product [Camellia sinensis]
MRRPPRLRPPRLRPPRLRPPPTEDRANVAGGAPPNVNLTGDLPQEQSKIEPLSPSDYASIKLESERALTAVRCGNHPRALKIMKEACSRHQNCALVYRAEANVHARVASQIDDHGKKQRHMKNAVESARRAVSLSPNSIEFAAFYVNQLYNASIDGKGYEEVVKECERALSIDNPTDPATESLQDEGQSEAPTAEIRIANLRNELQSLEQKCRISSSSTSMENLEIKVPIKTPEERRREIEDRVAAARLSQQKADFIQMARDQMKDFDVNAKDNKLSKQRKHDAVKKVMPQQKRMDQFRSCWNSMSVEKKRRLLELKIHDLREHFSSFNDNDGLASKTFSEAMGFAQNNKTWKFWSCFLCNEKFKDSEMQMQHIESVHKRNILSSLQEVAKQEVDADWADMLVNCEWKPVDTRRALEIMEKQSESPLANLDGESAHEEPKEVQVCSGSESRSQDDISKFGSSESGQNLQPVAGPDDQKWPLSDDVERARILESIGAEFRFLLRHNCLLESNFEKMIEETIDELHKFVPLSLLRIHGLDQTPLCICFLEAPRLEKFLEFLKLLSNVFGLNRSPCVGSSLDDPLNIHEIEGNEVKESIVFNGDSLCLLLDEHLLQGGLTPHKYKDAVADDGSAITGTTHHDEVEVFTDSDAFIHWLFSGSSFGEDLESWANTQDTTKHQGMNVIQTFEKEFDLLETWCRKETEKLSTKEALEAIGSIYNEEVEKREKDEQHIPQNYGSLLRKRQEELLGEDNDAMPLSSRFELNAISSLLTEAQEDEEAASTSITSLRSSDYVHQEDERLRIVFKRQLEKAFAEVAMLVWALNLEAYKYKNIRAGIIKSYRVLRQLRIKLKDAQFEALVDEDAKQKSDAARKELLSELALEDAEKQKGGNLTKHPQESSKAKKKNKNQRKVKDSKATSSDELYVLQEENEEQAESEIFGPGLRNDAGENNCFLNVIVQSLWHLRKFRDKFLSRSTSMHVHVGDPCVVCALLETFNALSAASASMPKEPVSPINLRTALCVFQEIKNASKVLRAILGVLHQSFTSGSGFSNPESAGSNYKGSWDCASVACIAHTVFGMDIFQKMNCHNCGIESAQMKFTCFFYIIRAITLRQLKYDYAESTFDELLQRPELRGNEICDPKVGGCGKSNNLHCILSTRPHVFATVLLWKSNSEPVDDISATLRALSTEIDIGVIFEDLDPGNKYSLISMVCRYQQHYICFVYNHEHEKWILYDDEILQVMGGWDEVLIMCETGQLQPEILFFEAAE